MKMSYGNVLDIHVRVNGNRENIRICYYRERRRWRDEAGLVFSFYVSVLEKSSEDCDHLILVKKTLLIGRFLAPYFLQVSLSPSPTSPLHFMLDLSATVRDLAEEDMLSPKYFHFFKYIYVSELA